MKKLSTLLFAIVISVGTITADIFENVRIGNLYYNLDTAYNSAEVTSNPSTYYSGSIVIPSVVTYGSYRFSVKSIGDDAFSGCSSLTSVTIPKSITSIRICAFENCSSLTSIEIPSSVTYIGDYAFRDCISLTSFDIPNSVTSIENGTFSGCTGLTSVTIPNSVTYIGEYAFCVCSNLTSVTIPNNITSIETQAFSGCISLTSIEIPNSVTSIGESAFAVCSSLTSVTIPNNVKSIEDDAFSGCSSLTSVTIPNSVTKIGSGAFGDCDNLTAVYITDIAAWCGISFDDDYSNPLYYAHNLYLNGDLVTDLIIPNSVTSIGDYAFLGCRSLTSVTIPNSITSIGNYAFAACGNLTSIEIPNSVTSIGDYAFTFCNSLTSPLYNAHIFAYLPTSYSGAYTIPYGIESISGTAFLKCDSLTSIEIPNSVTNIGTLSFGLCENLTTIYDYSSTPQKLAEGAFGVENEITRILYVPINAVETYKKNEDWKECLEYNFISEIKPINVIVDGVNYMPYFNSQTAEVVSLEEGEYSSDIIIAKQISCNDMKFTVTSIGKEAFAHYSGFKSVTIPNSVTTIGNSAFSGCSDLISVTIGNGVTYIGELAFDCNSLTRIICKAGIPPVLGSNVFYSVDKSIPLYVSEESIDAYKNADQWKDFTNFRAINSAITRINDVSYQDNEHKILRNGQIYILRGDHTYTLTGQEVK